MRGFGHPATAAVSLFLPAATRHAKRFLAWAEPAAPEYLLPRSRAAPTARTPLPVFAPLPPRPGPETYRSPLGRALATRGCDGPRLHAIHLGDDGALRLSRSGDVVTMLDDLGVPCRGPVLPRPVAGGRVHG